jgi:phytoene desaturase
MVARARDPIAVIGAGPGGLAAAMLLAASGLPVRIYEAMDDVGGRSGRVQIGPDFVADRGPTFFLMPYVLEEIFRAAGERLADHVRLTRLDPMYRLVVGPSEPGQAPTVLETTQDLDEMRRRIARLDERDANAFDAFIRDNRRKLQLMTPILRTTVRSPLDLVTTGSVRMAAYLNPHLSVSAYLERRFRHPAVRLALSFQSKYLGMSPLECPSLFTILPLIEYEYGIWHPQGGCSAVMRAMADACRNLGVEIRCACPVEAVEFQGQRVVGVRAGGEVHPHPHVVINADAPWALKRLIPAEVRRRAGGLFATDEQIDAKRYSCSTFMLYLGVRGRIDLPHHTVYISGSYRENLADIACNGRLSDDPSIYVCNPSVTDPTLAPPGDSSLYVLMPTPSTKVGLGIDWDRERDRARRLCLQQLERLGAGDLERRIVYEHVTTPADWERMNINFGAAFNLAHSLGQMLHRRVPHRAGGMDGVWFVGGATHPGSGLPVIWLSSKTTARLLCQELGVRCAADEPATRPIPRATPTPSAAQA